jgi:hypothetical protein
MAGLIDVGILKPELADYGRMEQQRNVLAQQKQQSELSQLKLDQLKQDQAMLTDLRTRLRAAGRSDDPTQFFQEMIRTGDPDYMSKGYEGLERYKDLKAYAKLGVIEPIDAAPTTPTDVPAPAAAAPASVVRLPQAPAQTNRLGSGTFGMEPAAPVNAMAPTAPAAPAAPVNALAAQPGAAQAARAQQRIDQLLMFARTNPRMAKQALEEARILQDQLEVYSKRGPNEPADVQTMQRLGYPLTQAGYQAFRDAQRQDRILSPEEEAQRIRMANASRAPVQPVAPTITTVEDPKNPGKFLQVDARTYTGGSAGSPGVIGGARPSAATEKVTAQRTQMNKDLGFAITQLADVTKDGGLIDQSTGSGAGQLVDVGAGFFGKATKGSIAIGKLAPIADLVLKMVPRFEGPQSDKDTKSYKEAAGQLANPSLPTEIRKQAGKTVLRLMQERKNQFVTSDMAAEGAGAAGAGGVVDFGSLK